MGEDEVLLNSYQYRICFKWKEAGPYDVEITDYH